MPAALTSRPLDHVVAVSGSVLVVASLVIIWAARSTVHRPAYVSELGVLGEPTAQWFEMALLLLAGGGSAIAWAARDIRSTAPMIGRWSPAVSLWVGCAFFVLASQVPCSLGCPLPYGSTFTGPDLVHTLAAVVAFAAACIAMLQAAFTTGYGVLARVSLGAAVLVAVIAGAGGLLSVLRFGTDFGTVFELVATTIAIGWLVAFGGVVAWSRRPPARRPELSGATALL